MRIDAHVHAFPDRLALAVRERLNRTGALTDDPLLPGVARRVRERGFDAAWILPYAHRAGVASAANEWSAAEVSRHAGLIAGATFHPADEELAKLVHRALDVLGLRVIKLHCSVGQFSPADQRLHPLWDAASRLHVPIVIHAGQRDGGRTAADEVAELVPVLSAYPALPVVLAHTAYPAVDAALDLMRRFPNLYADLTPVWLDSIPVPARVLEQFAGRFLFGSDAPNSPLAPGVHESRIASLALSPNAKNALLGETAAALVPVSIVDKTTPE